MEPCPRASYLLFVFQRLNDMNTCYVLGSRNTLENKTCRKLGQGAFSKYTEEIMKEAVCPQLADQESLLEAE